MKLFQNALCNVIDHKTSHVDWILCRGIRRGIGEIKLFQIYGAQPGADCGGEHVNPFVYSFISYNLGSQQAERSFSKTTFMVISFPPG